MQRVKYLLENPAEYKKIRNAPRFQSKHQRDKIKLGYNSYLARMVRDKVTEVALCPSGEHHAGSLVNEENPSLCYTNIVKGTVLSHYCKQEHEEHIWIKTYDGDSATFRLENKHHKVCISAVKDVNGHASVGAGTCSAGVLGRQKWRVEYKRRRVHLVNVYTGLCLSSKLYADEIHNLCLEDCRLNSLNMMWINHGIVVPFEKGTKKSIRWWMTNASAAKNKTMQQNQR